MERAMVAESDPVRLTVRKLALLAGVVLLALALVGSAVRPLSVGAERESDHQVSGAGKTIIEGGTGGTQPIPVISTLAFHANAQGGDFECLALAPATASGAESGAFEVNAMYVTGKVTSVTVTEGTALLGGTATVTGLGAGADRPFTFTVKAGGPGSTATLVVSGLAFHEILLEGQFRVK